jgi:hypothetical protein
MELLQIWVATCEAEFTNSTVKFPEAKGAITVEGFTKLLKNQKKEMSTEQQKWREQKNALKVEAQNELEDVLVQCRKNLLHGERLVSSKRKYSLSKRAPNQRRIIDNT